jgi:hypothetical protein
MILGEEIFEGVELDGRHDYLHNSAPYSRDFGFSYIHQDRVGGAPQIKFVGFGVAGWQEGTPELSEEFTSITEFNELKPDMREGGRVLKGVGARIYNTPQALRGTAEDPKDIGAYEFTVDPDVIYDDRYSDTTWSQVLRIGRQVLREGSGKILGLERTVDLIHRSQGKKDAVLTSQTPAGLRQQERRGAKHTSVVPEEFMIIRNALVSLKKIGEYHRS